MSTAYNVAQLLISAGITGAFGSQERFATYVGTEPEKPRDCVTIYDTGGGETETDEMDIHTPTFQVRIRSRNYLEAYTLHRAVKKFLQSGARSVGPMSYFGFMVTSDINSIGPTEKDSHILVASYRTVVQEEE